MKIEPQQISKEITSPIQDKFTKLKKQFDDYIKLKKDDAANKRIADEKRRVEEEINRRNAFMTNNQIKTVDVKDQTKPKLATGKLFSIDNLEKQGLCCELGVAKITIESNHAINYIYKVIDQTADSIVETSNLSGTYIQFSFGRRRAKISHCRIQHAYYDRYRLVNFKILVSNDNYNWETLSTQNEDDGTTKQEAIAIWYPFTPLHAQENENYYHYIKIVQTGVSYNSGRGYKLAIPNIEFFGKYS